ncbi:class I SAM-dependent DNA methyltransferase [Actinopolyspora mortivallis]|uniref:class I SAM-dependent DNA methyltransferase n=1 Tax=Actinopolyspora mortivallis TaxID=33906 RepID=UPI000A03AB35|nr:class I SAM-dependent methyltransferase [Actinopolyspora mortivallis]
MTSQQKDATSFDIIKRSHQLDGGTDNLKRYYRTWAVSYDHDVASENYSGPTALCDILEKVCGPPQPTTRVLDAGCGTGLVGLELVERGYTTIDGCDLSPEMVDVASKTGAYRWLQGDVDLNWDIDSSLVDSYDVVVACGVFTVGHVLPLALNQLIKATRPGGLVVVSTRESYLKQVSFVEHVQWLESESRAKLVERQDDEPYIAEEPATYWVLRRIT